jgi:hypothetical protein
MADRKQLNFTAKDILALTFSALALTLSGASFYLTNLRVADALSVRVVDLGTAVLSENGNMRVDPGRLVVKAVYVNSGTRDAIVTVPDFQFSGSPTLDNGGAGGAVAAPPGTFPFVLGPKQVRLVELPVPTATAQANLELGTPLPQGENDGARRFFLSFVFSAIDSLGNPHNRASGPQAQVHLSAAGVERLRPIRSDRSGREENFTATSLFE